MDSLESLYQTAGPALQAYLRRHVGRRGDADDLLQECFVIAARQSNSLSAADSPRAWLFGIARNLVREHHRRQARTSAATLVAEPATTSPRAADDRVEAMRAAIERLPEAQREVLELRLSQDLSYAEIAAALAIPVGTVRSRLHHAVAALRDRLAVTTRACQEDRP